MTWRTKVNADAGLVFQDHLSAEKPGDATKSNTKSVRLETVTDLYQRARRQKNVNGTALVTDN